MKLLFTKNQFLKYYMNLGSFGHSTEKNNSFYLLGLYYNISVINLTFSIFKLKKNLSVFYNILSKTKLGFLVVNSINSFFFQSIYIKKYKKYKISFFLGNWISGLLRNYKETIKMQKKRKNVNFFFYKKRLPSCSLFLNFNTFFKPDEYAYIYSKESNRLSIFSTVISNSSINLYKSPEVILFNLQTNINVFFINDFFFSILKIFFSVTKKFFFLKIVNKYNLFNIKKCLRFVFYNLKFCLHNKKNYLKINA